MEIKDNGKFLFYSGKNAYYYICGNEEDGKYKLIVETVDDGTIARKIVTGIEKVEDAYSLIEKLEQERGG